MSSIYETESRPIREIAYDTLKRAIVTGEIQPGARIVETDYADRLHISRTPLREALRKLERDGLVEYIARRGVVVRAFTIQDVDQIYTIRNALEMLTLPAIIENITPQDINDLRKKLQQMDLLVAENNIELLSPLARDFHTQLTSISRQARILRVIDSQDEYIRRFSSMAISQENRRSEAQQEHHRLVDLAEARDLENFRILMQHHIDRSKEKCLEAMNREKQNREI